LVNEIDTILALSSGKVVESVYVELLNPGGGFPIPYSLKALLF